MTRSDRLRDLIMSSDYYIDSIWIEEDYVTLTTDDVVETLEEMIANFKKIDQEKELNKEVNEKELTIESILITIENRQAEFTRNLMDDVREMMKEI